MANLTGVDEADDGIRVQGVAASLDHLSDSLHRGFALSDVPSADCWLLLDTSPLGMQEPDEPALAELLNNHALSRVEPSRAGVPLELSLALLPLDHATSAGSELIRSSLALSLHELPSSRLAQGAGRVIAAWLECDGSFDAAPTALQRHLARVMFARRADGRIEWLRWYDPAVLWLLWPHLSEHQRYLLLGPIRRYWLLTPSGALACLSARTSLPQSERLPAASASVEFTTAQWTIIDSIGALNLALAQMQASEFDGAAFGRAAEVGMSALVRAKKARFTDRKDLAEYARRAVTCHPEFDRHPLVANRLRLLSAGEFFTAIIDDITDDQWQEIANDLTSTDRPSSR